MISIVVPTIAGREEHLERCVRAYAATTPSHQLIVVHDRATCGIAWQAGAELANSDYLHFSADDLEPLPGWWEAATARADQGLLPAPRITRPDATLESCGDWGVEMDDGVVPEMTRIPFMSRLQWGHIGPMIALHYYTDNWVSFKGRLYGIETAVTRDYAFVHHHATVGRGAGMTEEQRMATDRRAFEDAKALELRRHARAAL